VEINPVTGAVMVHPHMSYKYTFVTESLSAPSHKQELAEERRQEAAEMRQLREKVRQEEKEILEATAKGEPVRIIRPTVTAKVVAGITSSGIIKPTLPLRSNTRLGGCSLSFHTLVHFYFFFFFFFFYFFFIFIFFFYYYLV
jgi:hypothetical protein